jgi:aerobic carbon-monoxide dehydrogenase medium subunit
LKPAPFVYHAPVTLPEALGLLATLPDARALAGGQSLMPMLNFRLLAPQHVVDLNRIDGLSFIREEPGAVVIGAMTRQRDIEKSEIVARRLPLLAEAIMLVGHRQTRNRGTLGGSLAHLDPSAELPAVALALDAELTLESSRGSRRLAMSEFPKGMLSTALAADELVTEVRMPTWPERQGYAFVEYARRHGDFAVASACALVEVKESGILKASLTLGGVGPVPLRMPSVEAALVEGRSIEESVKACASVEALDDPTYPAWYRQHLAVTLARRALEQALKRAAS